MNIAYFPCQISSPQTVLIPPDQHLLIPSDQNVLILLVSNMYYWHKKLCMKIWYGSKSLPISPIFVVLIFGLKL